MINRQIDLINNIVDILIFIYNGYINKECIYVRG